MALKSQKAGSKKPKVTRNPPKPSNRPRAMSSASASGSSDDSGSGSDEKEDQAAMLAALEAHTRAMLGLDGPEQAESSEQARRRLSRAGRVGGSDDEGDEGEEGEDGDESDDDVSDEDAEEFESDDGWGEGDEMVTDSEDEETGMMVPPPPKRVVPSVPEVVFAETGTSSRPEPLSNAERRAFLKGNSAKMMGIKTTAEFVPRRLQRALGAGKDQGEDDEEEDDQSNLKLDKTLHDMLLTTLLPSAEASAVQRPVDKRKAMNGRLLDLASYQLPGEGSKQVSTAHLSSHSAKIRTGMIHAKAKREAKARAEAEAAGSFVRGLGGLAGEGKGYKADKGRGQRAALGEDTGKKKGMDGRKGEKRDRGLGSGFGKFQGGMLRLSEADIARGSGEGNKGKSFGKRKRR